MSEPQQWGHGSANLPSHTQGGLATSGHPASPEPKPKRPTGLILGLVVAALLASAVGVVLLSKDSTQNDAAVMEPDAVAEAFLNALMDRDVGELRALACGALIPSFDEAAGDLPRQLASVVSQWQSWEATQFAIYDVDQDGDNATVWYELAKEDGTGLMAMSRADLLREDGQWRVCSV